jgi:methylglyoxal synthase
MPHDVDIKALQRLALIYNVPHAFNEATADLLVASGFLSPEGAKITPHV